MTDLYDVFTNINIMLTKYRGYKITSPEVKEKAFKKTMQLYQYVKIEGVAKDGNKSTIFLFAADSKNAAKKEHFRRLINTINSKKQEIICITRVLFSSYIRKYVNTLNHTVFNYLHRNFCTEVTKGPFCSPHVLLTPDEARELLSVQLKINPLGLPKIYIDDVQAIWIGAKMGQIVKIISNSPLTGKTCRYRIVTQRSGQILQEVDDDSDDEAEVEEDSDDEVEEKKEIPDEDDDVTFDQ